jgi:nitroimidazol reductase NimA-like FMN-containing flavoprotein (pyridoxamine 5'-phosphate oxidase superfamily)
MLGALPPEAVERLLHDEVIGRLGLTDGTTAYVVPITYAYDGHAVYGHSREGRKLAMMRANPRVCFEVDRWRDLANWESVIAWGRAELLEGPAAQAAMTRLVERVAPLLGAAHPHAHGVASHPTGDATVFRIVLDERTGRFEHTAPSLPES